MGKSNRMGRRGLTFLCCLLAVPTAVKLMGPNIQSDSLETSLMAGILLGVCYLVVRPVLRVLSVPIGCLTMGLFTFVIDAALILVLPQVFPGFRVAGFAWALLMALFVDGVCLAVGGS